MKGRVVSRPSKEEQHVCHPPVRFFWRSLKLGVVWECPCGQHWMVQRCYLGQAKAGNEITRVQWVRWGSAVDAEIAGPE